MSILIEHSFNGKVVLITGGANGIGAAIAYGVIRESAKCIVILDIDGLAGKRTENAINATYGKGRAKYYNVDVTNDDAVNRVFDEVLNIHKSIDVVINNAGIAREDSAWIASQINLNFAAVVNITMKAWNHMRKDKGGDCGTIINISSVAALAQSHEIPLYSACKSAVLQFSNGLGMEPNFNLTGVRVITICFGLTDTNLIQNIAPIDEKWLSGIVKTLQKVKSQSVESAWRAVLEAFKTGSSGSSWIAIEDQSPIDYTKIVQRGYASMNPYYANQ